MSAFDHVLVERGRGDPLDHHRPPAGAECAQSAGASRAFGGARPLRRRSRAARRGDHRRGRARLLRRQRPEGARRRECRRSSADRLRRHLASLRSREAGDRRGERARARRRRRDRRGLRSRDRGRPRRVRAARAARRPRGARRRRPAAARAQPAAEIRHGAGAHRPPLRRRGGQAHRADQRRGAARGAEDARAPDGRRDHRGRAARDRGLEAGDAAEPRDARPATALRATYPAAERMLASEDAREGQRAFVEKRKPRWQGK